MDQHDVRRARCSQQPIHHGPEPSQYYPERRQALWFWFERKNSLTFQIGWLHIRNESDRQFPLDMAHSNSQPEDQMARRGPMHQNQVSYFAKPQELSPSLWYQIPQQYHELAWGMQNDRASNIWRTNWKWIIWKRANKGQDSNRCSFCSSSCSD